MAGISAEVEQSDAYFNRRSADLSGAGTGGISSTGDAARSAGMYVVSCSFADLISSPVTLK
jgi:hypothetical protein